MSKYKKKNGIKGESLIYEMKKMKLTNYKKKSKSNKPHVCRPEIFL